MNFQLNLKNKNFIFTAYTQNEKNKKILYYVLGYIELRTYKVFLSTQKLFFEKKSLFSMFKMWNYNMNNIQLNKF